MSDRRRQIRMFPELGNPWPLWEDDGPLLAPTPSDLGLSADLEMRLSSWYQFWEAHHNWQHGWDTPENEQSSWRDGTDIVATLKAEVASFADVSDERIRPPRTY